MHEHVVVLMHDALICRRRNHGACPEECIGNHGEANRRNQYDSGRTNFHDAMTISRWLRGMEGLGEWRCSNWVACFSGSGKQPCYGFFHKPVGRGGDQQDGERDHGQYDACWCSSEAEAAFQ